MSGRDLPGIYVHPDALEAFAEMIEPLHKDPAIEPLLHVVAVYADTASPPYSLRPVGPEACAFVDALRELAPPPEVQAQARTIALDALNEARRGIRT